MTPPRGHAKCRRDLHQDNTTPPTEEALFVEWRVSSENIRPKTSIRRALPVGIPTCLPDELDEPTSQYVFPLQPPCRSA